MKKLKAFALSILALAFSVSFFACNNKYSNLAMSFYLTDGTKTQQIEMVIEEGKSTTQRVGVKFSNISSSDVGQVLIYSSPNNLITTSEITYNNNMCYTTLTANSTSTDGKLIVKHLSSNKTASIKLVVQKRASQLTLKNSNNKYVVSIPEDGENEHIIQTNSLLSINGTDKIYYRYTGNLPAGVQPINVEEENNFDSVSNLVKGFKVSNLAVDSQIQVYPVLVMKGFETQANKYENKAITVKFAKTLSNNLSLTSTDNYKNYLQDVVYLIANDVQFDNFQVEIKANGEAIDSYLDYYDLSISVDNEDGSIVANQTYDNKIDIKAVAFTQEIQRVTIKFVPKNCVGDIESAEISVSVKGEVKADGISVTKNNQEVDVSNSIDVYDTYSASSALGALFKFKPTSKSGNEVYSNLSKMQIEIASELLNYGGNTNQNNVYENSNFENQTYQGLVLKSRYVLAIYKRSQPLKFYKSNNSLLSEPITLTDNIYIRYVDNLTGQEAQNLTFNLKTINDSNLTYLQGLENVNVNLTFDRKDGVENLIVDAGWYEYVNNNGKFETYDQPNGVDTIYLNRLEGFYNDQVAQKFLYIGQDSVKGYQQKTISTIDFNVSVTSEFDVENSLKIAELDLSQTTERIATKNLGSNFVLGYNSLNINIVVLVFNENTSVGKYKITFSHPETGFKKEITCYVYESLTADEVELDLDQNAKLNPLVINNKTNGYSNYSAADYIVAEGLNLNLNINIPQAVKDSKLLKSIDLDFSLDDVENKNYYFDYQFDAASGYVANLEFKHGTFVESAKYVTLRANVKTKVYDNILTESDSENSIQVEIVFYVYEPINYQNVSINKKYAEVYLEDYLGIYNKSKSKLNLTLNAMNQDLWNYVDGDVTWNLNSTQEYNDSTSFDYSGNNNESVSINFKSSNQLETHSRTISAKISQFGKDYNFQCVVSVKKPVLSDRVVINNELRKNLSTGRYELNLKKDQSVIIDATTYSNSENAVVTHSEIALQVFNKNTGSAIQNAVNIDQQNKRITVNSVEANLRLVVFAKDALAVRLESSLYGYGDPSAFLINDYDSEELHGNAFVVIDLILSDGTTKETAFLISSADDFWDIRNNPSSEPIYYALTNNIDLSNTTQTNTSTIENFKDIIFSQNDADYSISGLTLNKDMLNLFNQFNGKLENLNFNINYSYVISGELAYNLGLIGVNNGELVNVSVVIAGKAELNADNLITFGGLVGNNKGIIRYTNKEVVGASGSLQVLGNATAKVGGLVGLNSADILGAYEGSDAQQEQGVSFSVTISYQGVTSNLNLSVALTNSTSAVGGLVGRNIGNIQNCEVRGIINTFNNAETNRIGGVIGENETIVKDVIITLGNGAVTGVTMPEEYYVKNVTSSVKINAPKSQNVGGVVGYDKNGSYLKIKYQMLPVDEKTTSASSIEGLKNVGGLIGYSDSAKIAYSSVVSYYWDYFNLPTTFNNQQADIIAEDYVGGLVGFGISSNTGLSDGSVTISNKLVITYSSVNAYLSCGDNIGGVLSTSSSSYGVVFNAYFMGLLDGNVVYTPGITQNLNIPLCIDNNGATKFNIVYTINAADDSQTLFFGYNDPNILNIDDYITLPYWNYNSQLWQLNGGYIYVVSDQEKEKPIFDVAPTKITAEIKGGKTIDISENQKGLLLNYYDFTGSVSNSQILSSLNEQYNTYNLKYDEILNLGLFEFSCLPSSLKNLALYVTSSNPNVVSITYDGKLIVRGIGNAKLTFRSILNPGVKTEILVDVCAPVGDTFNLIMDGKIAKNVNIGKMSSKQFVIQTSGLDSHKEYYYKTSEQIGLKVVISVNESDIVGNLNATFKLNDYLSISGKEFTDAERFSGKIILDYSTPFTITVEEKLLGNNGPIPLTVSVTPYLTAKFKDGNFEFSKALEEEFSKEFTLKLCQGATEISLNYNSAILYPNDITFVTLKVKTDIELNVSIDVYKNDVKLESSDTTIECVSSSNVDDNGIQTFVYKLNFASVNSATNLTIKFKVGSLTESIRFLVLPQRINKIEIKNYLINNNGWELSNVLKQSSQGLMIIDLAPFNGYFDYLEIKDISGLERILFTQFSDDPLNGGTTLSSVDTPTEDNFGIKLVKDYTNYKEGRLFVATQVGNSTASALHGVEVSAYVYDVNGVPQLVAPNEYSIQVRMLPQISATYKGKTVSSADSTSTGEFYLASGTEIELEILTKNSDGEVDATLTGVDGYSLINDNGNFYILKNSSYNSNDIGKTLTLTLKTYSYRENGFETAEITLNFKIVKFVVHGVTVSPSVNNAIYGSFNREVPLEIYFSADDVSYYNGGIGFQGMHVDDIITTADDNLLAIKAILTKINSYDEIESFTNSSNETVINGDYGKNKYLVLDEDDNKISIYKNKITVLEGYTAKSLAVKFSLELENSSWSVADDSTSGSTLKEVSTSYALTFSKATQAYEAKLVKNEEDFLKMQSGKIRYILGNDLTLTNYKPLDIDIIEFDGNGRTITIESFAKFDEESIKAGLFKQIYSGMTVKNIVLNYQSTFNSELGIHTLGNADSKSLPNDYKIEFYDLCNNSSVNYTDASFGGITPTNNGIITNCEVKGSVALRASTVEAKTENSSGQYTINFNVGGVVAVNTSTGYITNSINNLKMFVQANYGGFVYSNAGTISSCAVEKDAIIYTYNSNLERTIIVEVAGFAVKNTNSISMSYVNLDSTDIMGSFAPKDLSAGFVYTNSGEILDAYVRLIVDHKSNAFAGFVQQNTGTISKAYTFINKGKWLYTTDSMFANSSEGLTDCIEIVDTANSSYPISSEGLYTVSTAERFLQSTYVEHNFTFGNNKDAIWQITSGNLPVLVSTLQKVRYTGNESTASDDKYYGLQTITQKIEYIIKDGVEIEEINDEIDSSTYGTKENPYIITSVEDWTNYFTKENFNKYFRIVADIDFEDLGSNPISSSISFSGNIQGNNMLIKNIMLYSEETDLEAIGLFKALEKISSLGVDAVVGNLKLSTKSVWASKVNSVGLLAGTIDSYNIYNITIDAENVVMVGKNAVGGLAGLIRGAFDVENISSNIGVNSTRLSNSTNYAIYMSTADDARTSNLSDVYYSGSVAGILDGYNSNRNTYQTIKDIKVNGSIVAIADTVGAAFGFVGKKVIVDGVNVELTNAKLSGVQYSGGIAGENRGQIKNATVTIIDNTFEQALPTYKNNTFSNSTYISAGAVGLNLGGLILNTKVEADIIKSTNSTTVGGLVGRNVHGCIMDSSFDGRLMGNLTGGFVGANYSGALFKAQNTSSGVLTIECRGLVPTNDMIYVVDGKNVSGLINLELSEKSVKYLYENRALFYSYSSNAELDKVLVPHKALGLIIGATNREITFEEFGFKDSCFVLNPSDANDLTKPRELAENEDIYAQVNDGYIVKLSAKPSEESGEVYFTIGENSYVYTALDGSNYIDVMFLTGTKTSIVDAWETYWLNIENVLYFIP